MTTLRNASGRMVPLKCCRPAARKRHCVQRENLAVEKTNGGNRWLIERWRQPGAVH